MIIEALGLLLLRILGILGLLLVLPNDREEAKLGILLLCFAAARFWRYLHGGLISVKVDNVIPH